MDVAAMFVVDVIGYVFVRATGAMHMAGMIVPVVAIGTMHMAMILMVMGVVVCRHRGDMRMPGVSMMSAQLLPQ